MAHKVTFNEALDNTELTVIDLFTESVVPALCSEGCMVEPDGVCEHGFPSAIQSYFEQ